MPAASGTAHLLCLFSDHAELPAQVRAPHSHSAGGWPAEDDHQPLLPRNPVYSSDSLPERGGMHSGGENATAGRLQVAKCAK